MLLSDADTLSTMLITHYHPAQHISVHRVDLQMQLHAVKANATMLLLTSGRTASTGNAHAWQKLPRIGGGSSRVVPHQARRLSAYGEPLWRN